MKFIPNRDFREISLNSEWISLEQGELSKNTWKKYGSKGGYLDNVYPSNWRMVFCTKNRLIDSNVVSNLFLKSFENHFMDEKSINQLESMITSLTNPNLKKKRKNDKISLFVQNIVKEALISFLNTKNVSITEPEVDDFLENNSDFCYTIPFIDPKQIIEPGPQKTIWNQNSIESFLRNNLLIQVKTNVLEQQGIGIGLFIRKDLKLGKGKSGAQLSHGAISLLHQPTFKSSFNDAFKKSNEKNILIYHAKDLKSLMDIQNLCIDSKINHAYITDAGHTQIDPGTATVIAVGPIPLIWIKILAYNAESIELS